MYTAAKTLNAFKDLYAEMPEAEEFSLSSFLDSIIDEHVNSPYSEYEFIDKRINSDSEVITIINPEGAELAYILLDNGNLSIQRYGMEENQSISESKLWEVMKAICGTDMMISNAA